MPPASKSKSKDKTAARAAKEQPKDSLKPSLPPANGAEGVPASAYNPISGTFHTTEASAAPFVMVQNNGRFRMIDEPDESSAGSLGTTGDFDSASNNDSCSGESEDQKEKTTNTAQRVECIPGCDTDKRDKIRQKNERKHQRQKEKRAQELHDRCTGYLMSRKLEVLAEQLVGMGFTSEQATMALIQNEGNLEESVAWLFEVGEDNKKQIAANLEFGANLKINITDELAKIADLEVKFKFTKQEVERAVVACEGDLTKAEQTLKAQKQELAAAPSNLQASGDQSTNKVVISAQIPTAKAQVKGVTSIGTQQQRRDERDVDNTRSLVNGAVSQETANKNLLRRIHQLKTDLGGQVAAPLDLKRWSTQISNTSGSYSLSPSQAAIPPTKSDARYIMAGNDAKTNMKGGALREPVIVMQRPQSINANKSLPSTSLGMSVSPPASSGWYFNGMPGMVVSEALGHGLHHVGLNGSATQQFIPQRYFQSVALNPTEPASSRWGGSWNSGATPPSSLAMPSSLGLFTGWGSSSGSSSSSPVDWSSGGSTPCDYTSIDWSLDMTLLKPSVKSERLLDTWSTMFMGGKIATPADGNGVYMGGFRGSSLVTDSSSLAGSHEWTSPFAANDLLGASRKFVTSPSL
ncbi:uncharacterized protein [Typha latifolia]|uniref:uncharacterized protein n=1 Tax=Typha latifolia TaxID=4733 RepID=UPI003C2B17F0